MFVDLLFLLSTFWLLKTSMFDLGLKWWRLRNVANMRLTCGWQGCRRRNRPGFVELMEHHGTYSFQQGVCYVNHVAFSIFQSCCPAAPCWYKSGGEVGEELDFWRQHLECHCGPPWLWCMACLLCHEGTCNRTMTKIQVFFNVPMFSTNTVGFNNTILLYIIYYNVLY